MRAEDRLHRVNFTLSYRLAVNDLVGPYNPGSPNFGALMGSMPDLASRVWQRFYVAIRRHFAMPHKRSSTT